MRIILFFLFTFCISEPVLSQRPTQKEIAAQKQEALNDARQQVAEMKKEIAEAKAKNEDPETIKEMEKQLAMLQKMVTMLEGTNLSGNTRSQTLPPPKAAEPKYVSSFQAIALKQPFKTPTEDQAKDLLLWYKGKKIDPNTLITTRGMIVRYDRQRNIVIVQPDKKVDTNYYGFVNTLDQTPKIKSQFGIGASGVMNSFLMWPEILKAYDEFDIFRKRYEKIISNTIDLPVLAKISPSTNSRPPIPVNQTLNIDQQLYQLYEELKRAMADLENKINSNSLRFTEPPERPNDLCSCDPKKRQNYESDLADWFQKLWADDEYILSYYQTIHQHLEERPAGRATGDAPSDLGATLNQAVKLIIGVRGQKIWELNKLVENGNIYLEEGLVEAVVSFEKFLIAINATDKETEILKGTGYARIERVRDLFFKKKVFEKYIRDQMAQRNYNVVLDYSLFMSHEWNKKFLDANYEIPHSKVWWDEMKKFNRFTLSITLDFDYRLESAESRVLMATGTLETKKMIVSLGRSGCKWQIHLSDVNHSGQNTNEDTFYIPIKILRGTKTIYRDPKPPLVFSYTGPAQMEMVFPEFELTFCNTGRSDTVFMQKLRYAEKVANAYMVAHPNIDFGKEYSLDMFQYVNKMFISILKTKENMTDLVNMAGNMMNIQSQTQLPNSTGNQNLDNLMMDFIMNQKRRLFQQGHTPITNTEKTILAFDAVNGAVDLVSASFDTADPADPDRQAGIKMVHGIVIIKVTHTPQ